GRTTESGWGAAGRARGSGLRRAGGGAEQTFRSATRQEPRLLAARLEGRHSCRVGAGTARLADRYRSLGRTLKEAGRLAEADAAWRHAFDLMSAAAAADPGDAAVLRRWCDCANDLAWFRLNHPEPSHRDVDSAIAMARRTVETCSDCGTYWNTLGLAHLRAG